MRINKKRRLYVLLLLATAGAAILLMLSQFTISTRASVAQLESRIREVLRLHTAEYLYRDIIYVGEETRVLGFQTRDQHVLFSIHLRVLAGIDLHSDTFSVSAKHRPGSTGIQISLPPARILAVDADERSIRQYLAGGRGTPISMLSYYTEIHAAKTHAEQDAIERGVLNLAERNARGVIENLLNISGFTNVTFTRADPPETQTAPQQPGHQQEDPS